MTKDLRISIKKPFLIYDFAPDPWNFFICEENFLFFFISVHNNKCCTPSPYTHCETEGPAGRPEDAGETLHRRRQAGTGGVEWAPAASSGHRRRRAGTGGVERAPAVSSGHRRRRAGTGGVERAPPVLFACRHRRTDYL
jgi:hypothetical protein